MRCQQSAREFLRRRSTPKNQPVVEIGPKTRAQPGKLSGLVFSKVEATGTLSLTPGPVSWPRLSIGRVEEHYSFLFFFLFLFFLSLFLFIAPNDLRLWVSRQGARLRQFLAQPSTLSVSRLRRKKKDLEKIPLLPTPEAAPTSGGSSP